MGGAVPTGAHGEVVVEESGPVGGEVERRRGRAPGLHPGRGRVGPFGDENFNRALSTVAIAAERLYVSDLSGFLYCLDVRTGKRHWRHDTFAAVWGSPYVVDGKVMLGTEDGEMVVLKHAPKLEVLAANDLGNSIYTTPVAANGVLYVVNRRTLFAIQEN